MNTYIFHKGNAWYPVEYFSDAQAIHDVFLNPGTIKIESIDIDGLKEIWNQTESSSTVRNESAH